MGKKKSQEKSRESMTDAPNLQVLRLPAIGPPPVANAAPPPPPATTTAVPQTLVPGATQFGGLTRTECLTTAGGATTMTGTTMTAATTMTGMTQGMTIMTRTEMPKTEVGMCKMKERKKEQRSSDKGRKRIENSDDDKSTPDKSDDKDYKEQSKTEVKKKPRQSRIAPRKKSTTTRTAKGPSMKRLTKTMSMEDVKTKTSTARSKVPDGQLLLDTQNELYKFLGKTLTANTWYHGLMPRSDCEEILKNDGDFLVRKTTVAKVPTYCLSVCHEKETKHIPLTYEKGMWILKDVNRGTLAELIDFFVSEKRVIPPSNAILRHSIPRPEFYILHENVVLLKKLGNGAFGEVFSGRLRQKNGDEIDVAVKKIKGEVKKAQLADFVREAKLMRRFDHPNIVRVYGVAPQEEPIMIVLELAHGGTLKGYCKKNSDCSEDQLLTFARDGARGMCYLAGRQVIHRDLAARNCLLGKNNEVKISDFGLSVADTKELKMNKLKSVPIKWLAPETLTAGSFTKKTDVWSFGVLLWEIFSRCQSDPFPGQTNQQAKAKICNSTPPIDPPYGSPPIVVQVMEMCFKKNPDERADFEAVLKALSPDEVPPPKMEGIED